MYQDLAKMMAKTTKFLQLKDIQIHDVGRRIMTLFERLKGNYPESSDIPIPLLGDGTLDEIMSELFD